MMPTGVQARQVLQQHLLRADHLCQIAAGWQHRAGLLLAGHQHREQRCDCCATPLSSSCWHGSGSSIRQQHTAQDAAAERPHQRGAPALQLQGGHRPPPGYSIRHTDAQQQHAHRGSMPGRSSSSSSSSSSAVQQVPDAPGTPRRPPPQAHHSRHLAASHLARYLASITSQGFVEDLAGAIVSGDRLAISRALTLCESSRPDHALQAAALLRKLVDNGRAGTTNNNNASNMAQYHQQQQQAHPQQQVHLQQQQQQQQRAQPPLQQHTQQQAQHQPPSHQLTSSPTPSPSPTPTPTPSPSSAPTTLRVGVSGPPGAGKSSLIEAWGCYLADQGCRVAVLAVDPSSVDSGGAILGDKTRMARLGCHPNAYVRPSPARGTLGGVSRATYDAMLICEAAGYDRVLVETVGVGQSEVAAADLVDAMVLVMPPVGGDELQGIKRGIMEVADIVAVNKADGDTEKAAARAASEYSGCVRLMPHRYRAWEPQVLCVSAHTGKGVPELARLVQQFHDALAASGELQRCRVQRSESVAWLCLEEQLLGALRADPHVAWLLGRLLPCVRAGTMAPRSAADIALAYFYDHC